MELREAIEHAKKEARRYGGTPRGEKHEQLAIWLTELELRRSHVPLRCRVGLHKTVTGMGLCGPPFLLTCILCGGQWYAM